ncbi:hypothetical protein BHE74_00019580 [Ensete ventricosum]|nr:hypothetical protein BHE74_00019580 [Ensete ventricosum]
MNRLSSKSNVGLESSLSIGPRFGRRTRSSLEVDRGLDWEFVDRLSGARREFIGRILGVRQEFARRSRELVKGHQKDADSSPGVRREIS